MPIKMIPFCVFDLETTGLDTDTCQPIQIACRLYHGRSLEFIPGSEFCEFCKPTKDCIVSQQTYEITKIDPKNVENAPDIKFVWNKFIEHVKKYNKEKNKWTAPIPVAHNLHMFDGPIADRMNKLFGPKKEETVLFSNTQKIDTLDFIFPLFENTNALPNYKLDSLREFFGLSKEGAHTADKDVEQLGMIFTRIMKFYREIGSVYIPKMRGCFSDKSKSKTVVPEMVSV